MGGDGPVPNTNESMANVMQAYQNYLPGILHSTADEIAPIEQAKAYGAQLSSPVYAKLQSDLYNQYAPGMATTGQQINQSNALAAANSDQSVLNGPGMGLVKSATDAQKIADPEYFKMREQSAKGYGDLLGAIGPLDGRLSGGEIEAINRSLAQRNQQTGNANNGSQLTAIGNAMQFGNAANDRGSQRRQELAGALGVGFAGMPTMKSGIDAFQVGTGRSSMPNPADSKFMGVQQAGVGSEAFGMGNNFLGETSTMRGQQNTNEVNRRDSIDRTAQIMSSIPNISVS